MLCYLFLQNGHTVDRLNRLKFGAETLQVRSWPPDWDAAGWSTFRSSLVSPRAPERLVGSRVLPHRLRQTPTHPQLAPVFPLSWRTTLPEPRSTNISSLAKGEIPERYLNTSPMSETLNKYVNKSNLRAETGKAAGAAEWHPVGFTGRGAELALQHPAAIFPKTQLLWPCELCPSPWVQSQVDAFKLPLVVQFQLGFNPRQNLPRPFGKKVTASC